MSFIDFAELKERVSIEDALAMLNLDLKKKGAQYRGPCPVCKSGGDRALVVTPAKSAFYCFASRSGGDVIAFVAHIQDTGMKEAAAFLAGNGIVDTRTVGTSTVGTSSRGNAPEERPKTRGAERRLQPLTYLQADHDAVQTLGVAAETAEAFEAGYAPKGIMRGRLALPVRTWDGELVAYTGRAVKDESPTLIFPNGFQPEQYLFNAHQVTDGELYLTRDPLDVLKAYQNGIENVVSFLTEMINAEQLQHLASLMDERGCESVELF